MVFSSDWAFILYRLFQVFFSLLILMASSGVTEWSSYSHFLSGNSLSLSSTSTSLSMFHSGSLPSMPITPWVLRQLRFWRLFGICKENHIRIQEQNADANMEGMSILYCMQYGKMQTCLFEISLSHLNSHLCLHRRCNNIWNDDEGRKDVNTFYRTNHRQSAKSGKEESGSKREAVSEDRI